MVLGRLYEVEDSIATVTVAAQLLALTVPATMSVQIIEASVTVDLDTSEQLECAIDIATGVAAGGGAVVAIPMMTGDAATSVVELSASAGAITGATAQNELVGAELAPSVVGWHYKPLDGTGHIFAPSEIIVIKTMNTISSATVRVRCVYAEIG